jgi:hypothetical protein
MKLLQGLLLGNGAVFLAGMLRGLSQSQLAEATGYFTTGVLFLAALALFWSAALDWKRKTWPVQSWAGLPGLERKERNESEAISFPATVLGSGTEGLIVRARLTDTLNAMVRNHYDNRSVSRASMVATNQCSQPYWNLAQAILVRLGIRVEGQPSIWQGSGSSVEDLKLLASHVQIEPARVQVLTAQGWELVDLVACHFL